jgi:hypothetical protein
MRGSATYTQGSSTDNPMLVCSALVSACGDGDTVKKKPDYETIRTLFLNLPLA